MRPVWINLLALVLPLFAFGKIEELSFGTMHGCARFDDGRVKCWGDNLLGKLGLGNLKHTILPPERPDFVKLGKGRRALRLATSWMHSCAILDNDQVKCWGDNRGGNLGTGVRTTADGIGVRPEDMGEALLPVKFSRAIKPIEISASQNANCVRTEDGEVWCWETGYGVEDKGVAKPIPHFRKATQVSTGYELSCAIVETKPICWSNRDRKLLPSPPVPDGRRIRRFTLKYDRACSLLDDDSIVCANFKELKWANSPVPDLDISGLVPEDVAVGERHACISFHNGTATCWGENYLGQIGIHEGRTGNAFLNLPRGHVIKQLTTGDCQTCALLKDDTVYCFGCWYGRNGSPVEIKL